MSAGTTWRRFWLHARSLVLPLGAYWGMTLLSVGLFTALIVVFEGLTGENTWALGGLWVGTVAGIALGQVMALLRLRTWVALTLSTVTFGLFVYGLVEVESLLGGHAGLGAAMALFCFTFFLVAGLWSLRVHMGLLATWVPMVFLTGSILFILDQTGKDSAWFAGDKWAVWDVFTAPILLFGVIMLLVYLASRELHRLHLWRYGPGGPDVPFTERKRRPVRAATMLPGCGGLVVVAILAVVLTAAAALVAPYLWRTGPGDDTDGDTDWTTDPMEGPSEQPQPAQEPPPDQGCNQDDPQGEGEGDQGDQGQQGEQGAQEMIQEAVQNAGISLLMLILLLALAIVTLAIFGPPLRRTLLLHHLRRPLWPVSPTLRVQLAWRLAEVALGDAGVHRHPGDTATTLAARAAETLAGRIDPEPVLVCAEIADRVLYGLGLRPDDTDKAIRLAEMAYQAVWEGLGEGEKLKAVYRLL